MLVHSHARTPLLLRHGIKSSDGTVNDRAIAHYDLVRLRDEACIPSALRECCESNTRTAALAILQIFRTAAADLLQSFVLIGDDWAITGNLNGKNAIYFTGAKTPLLNTGTGFFARKKKGYLPPPSAPTRVASVQVR